MPEQPISVLVVEDEALVRLNIVTHLEDTGFEVVEVANAAEAIRKLEANNAIRVVFTDVDMPGAMDGLEFSDCVRRRWPKIQIIVTSGKHLVETGDLPDGSLFFSKPYQLDAVVHAMRDMTGM